MGRDPNGSPSGFVAGPISVRPAAAASGSAIAIIAMDVILIFRLGFNSSTDTGRAVNSFSFPCHGAAISSGGFAGSVSYWDTETATFVQPSAHASSCVRRAVSTMLETIALRLCGGRQAMRSLLANSFSARRMPAA